MPHLHKQVNYIRYQIYLSNRSNRSNIPKIPENVRYIQYVEYSQAGVELARLLGSSLSAPALPNTCKKYSSFDRRKKLGTKHTIVVNLCEFFLSMEMSFCLSEFDLSSKSTYICIYFGIF